MLENKNQIEETEIKETEVIAEETIAKSKEEEMQELAAKMEKKFSKRPYSFDLKELIDCLSKDEIYNIARNLGVNKISSLTKPKLIEKLLNEYEELLEKRLSVYEEERYEILKSYIEKKGAKSSYELSMEEIECSTYFIQQGILFPTMKEKEVIFLMPEVVQKLIISKQTKEYKEILKANRETINLCRGLSRIYGVLKFEDLMQLLSKYSTRNISKEQLEELIIEAGYYYNEFRYESSEIINNDINDINELKASIAKECAETGYANVPKEEVMSMADDNWVCNTKAGKTFYKEFLSIFKVNRETTLEIMQVLAYEIQDKDLESAIEKVLKLINGNDVDVRNYAYIMIKKFLVKVRIWKYKGACLNDRKANATVERKEKTVGRNEPCICGSGKKYKKCCGR